MCNKDKSEYDREYYANNKQKILASSRAYSSAHKLKIQKYSRVYYELHKDECNERSRRWVATHRKQYLDKMRIYSRAYYAIHKMERQHRLDRVPRFKEETVFCENWSDLHQFANETIREIDLTRLTAIRELNGWS